MKRFLRRFDDQPHRFAVAHRPRKRNSRELRVMAPHDVHLPHPANQASEIRVPASINGVDLSTGRL